MIVTTLLTHCFKCGEDRRIGGAFFLVLNSQNKNPYKDIQVFVKTQAESYLAVASLIMIYGACFGTLYQLFRKKYIYLQFYLVDKFQMLQMAALICLIWLCCSKIAIELSLEKVICYEKAIPYESKNIASYFCCMAFTELLMNKKSVLNK